MSGLIKYRVWDTRTNQMSLVANISFGDDGSALTITSAHHLEVVGNIHANPELLEAAQ